MMKRNVKDSSYFNFLLVGTYIFYLGYLVVSYFLRNNKIISRPISLIGIIFVLWAFFKMRKTLVGVDNIFKPIYIIFVFVCLVNVVIGIPVTIINGNTMGWLFDLSTLWMYLVGLVFLLPVNINRVKCMITISLLYLITSFLFSIFYFNDLFLHPTDVVSSVSIGQFDGYKYGRPQEPGLLLFPISAFLIFFSKFSFKIKIIIIFAFFLAELAALFQGRRSISFVLLCYPLLALLVYYLNKGRYIIIFITIIFLVVITQNFLFNNNFYRAFENNFVVMAERYNANTREAVNVDFYKDMDGVTDWIIGRGMNGSYRSLQLSHISNINRSIVETGYLNIILHGGFLMLLPYIVILLYSFYRGYFHSKNIFVKACAVYVIFHLFLLIPGGHLRLTYECVILFSFIRICTTSSWRNMSNKELDEKLRFKFFI